MSDLGDDGPRTPPWYSPLLALLVLSAAVAKFVAARSTGRDPFQRGQDLRMLRHLINLLELVFAKWAAEFAASDAWDQMGAGSASEWVRHECHLSGVAAHSAITVGEQLPELTQSRAAVASGRIGYAHLAMLASTAAAIREPNPDGRFDEAPLLAKAQEHSVSRFRDDCAHERHAADAAGFLSDHLSDVEWRSFEMLPCEGGFVLRGRVDRVAGATLKTAIDALAKRTGPDDDRRQKRRNADALLELSNHALDSGELPTVGGERPHVQVTTTVETLMGLSGAPAGDLEFSTPIPAATVQRLACDSGVTRVLLGADSAVIDVGRKLRVPSAPMRRALRARDHGCAWPSCDRPASWTAAHHVRHWSRDGATEIPNLVLLCYRHHEKVHEGGWHIALAADGRVATVGPVPGAPQPRCEAPPTADEEEHRDREHAAVMAAVDAAAAKRRGP
ncbi:MAG: DUF222 domain-containing protein [Candidatus Dormibacteria bacterium]